MASEASVRAKNQETARCWGEVLGTDRERRSKAPRSRPRNACVLPSAIRAGLESLRPPRSLTWAAISLPTNPIASVAARWLIG
jgi:hypothetical protein